MEALQLISLHRPLDEAEPADYVEIRIPRVLLAWKKPNGQPVSGAARLAFAVLWYRAGYRERALEVNLAELGAFLGVSDNSAKRALKSLAEIGIARLSDRRRGARGGWLAVVRNPNKIAARRGLRTTELSPQRFIQFDASVDGSVELERKVTIPTDPSTEASTEASESPAVACPRGEHSGTGGTGCCATEAVDALSALKASLRSALSDSTYELWLQPCRFCFGSKELRIVAASKFNRDFISQTLGADIARACGEEIRLSFEFGDPTLPSTDPSTEASGGAQPTQQTKPNLTKPTNNAREGISSKPTEPSTDPWGGHALIAKTKAIIDRVDEGMYPWIAFSAVLAIEEGVLDQGVVDGWLSDDPYQFPACLKEALSARRSSLIEMVPVKTALWRRGIKWRRAWFKSRLKLRLESEQRAQFRRLPR